MAVVVNGLCIECDKPFTTTIDSGQPIPLVCPKCLALEEEKSRRLYFGGLDGLTIEERLRKIEEWIYDHKPYRGPVQF